MCLCLQGRQGGVEIDPWEDADYSIYKVIDRFGFMQYVRPFLVFAVERSVSFSPDGLFYFCCFQ